MKRIILSIALVVACFAVSAQKYMVINTEKIFKSIPKYNMAIEQVDKLGEQYQGIIDANYTSIESTYNDYQKSKATMTEAQRSQRENEIIKKEQDAEKYQSDIFGNEGLLMNKRVELIKPIQEAVFKAVNNYAELNGYTLVIDLSSNASIVYYHPTMDKTEDIIKIVKKI